MELWRLHPKQLELINFIDQHDYTLALGQGRAGKSMAVMFYLYKMALLNPNTQICCFRNTYSSIISGLFKQTLVELHDHFFPVLSDSFIINKSAAEVTFPNGSRICFKGLDTQERSQKILSQQYSIIFVDEIQLVDYAYISILMTRMPQSKTGIPIKFIFAANYSSVDHWSYKFFKLQINPITKKPLSGKIGYMNFSTSDNLSIDAEKYIKTLMENADQKAINMCAGSDWYSPEGTGPLWLQSDIQYISEEVDYDDIIVSYDPSVSDGKNSDGHGVCIAGVLDGKYYIIESYEKVCHPTVMANEIIGKYHDYKCSALIVEVNNGGKWIEGLIHNIDESINIENIHASQGKVTRCESIISLFKRKLVWHCDHFESLESQMLSYYGYGKSPNALDSCVYALKYLKEYNKTIKASDVW